MDYSPKQKKYEMDGNFFLIPEDIFDYELSAKAFIVYSYLSRCADKRGVSFPSRENIGKNCKISVVTVDKAVRELEDAGLVEVKHRYNDAGQTSNLYTLLNI